jgi:NAD(P)-dependent dehydrogenase (short-subunit alcohol dehydrogenase family)
MNAQTQTAPVPEGDPRVSAIVIGGTGGLGLPIARRLAARGESVIITSRDRDRAERAARGLGPHVRGIAVDLAAPKSLEIALRDVASVDHVVITGIAQYATSLASFDIDAAVEASTVKLVGYTEAVRVLSGTFGPSASVVLFGGLAKDRPYPGSTMVTAVNQGISGLVRTMAVELAPHRINAVHPGVVGDSPKWQGIEHPHASRTPLGRLVAVSEIVGAVEFLLDNTGINGQDLLIDGGLLAM